MVILKNVPLHEEQSLQIRILKQLAICLVTLLIPASNLTGLVMRAIVRSLNPRMAKRGFCTLSQYQNKPHLEHFFNEVAF
jgi:hypothetical protein